MLIAKTIVVIQSGGLLLIYNQNLRAPLKMFMFWAFDGALV